MGSGQEIAGGVRPDWVVDNVEASTKILDRRGSRGFPEARAI